MPLILRKAQGNRPGTWDQNDFDVKSGEFTVGRIYLANNINPPQANWYWAINGVHAGPTVMGKQGYGHSREEAMALLRENWNKWLAWAALREVEGG